MSEITFKTSSQFQDEIIMRIVKEKHFRAEIHDSYGCKTNIELTKSEIYELITKLQELHNLMS